MPNCGKTIFISSLIKRYRSGMEELTTFHDLSGVQGGDPNKAGTSNNKSMGPGSNGTPVVFHGLFEIKDDHYCATDLDTSDGFLLIQEKAVEPFTETEWDEILSKGTLKNCNQKKLYASLQLKIPSLL